MKLSVKQNDNRIVVTLEGMLDTDSSADFLREMNKLMEGGDNEIALEMGELQYVSSQGIRSILAVIKTMMAKNGKLVFRNVRPPVKDILEMSGLTQVMNFE